jgi:hypothetical protein
MPEIPAEVRPALRRELDALVAGERPELMVWVREYGESGTQLVPQPESIWAHPSAEFGARSDGSCFGVVPLWTRSESPSDLSAEFEIDIEGIARLTDVRVL